MTQEKRKKTHNELLISDDDSMDMLKASWNNIEEAIEILKHDLSDCPFDQREDFDRPSIMKSLALRVAQSKLLKYVIALHEEAAEDFEKYLEHERKTLDPIS